MSNGQNQNPKPKSKQGMVAKKVLLMAAVVFVAGILMMPLVQELLDRANGLVDESSVRTLNLVTAQYMEQDVRGDRLFGGLVTDQSRMEALVEAGYLAAPLHPRREGTGFYWNRDHGQWEPRQLLKADRFPGIADHDLQHPAGFQEGPRNSWTVREAGLVVESGSLFWPLGRDEYEITVLMGRDPASGEEGELVIRFDTVLSSPEGAESSQPGGQAGIGVLSAGYGLVYHRDPVVPCWEIRRIGWNENRGVLLQVIPVLRESEEPDAQGLPGPDGLQQWEVHLVVRNASGDEGQKELTVHLDDQVLIEGWRFPSPARSGRYLFAGLESGSQGMGFLRLQLQ